MAVRHLIGPGAALPAPAGDGWPTRWGWVSSSIRPHLTSMLRSSAAGANPSSKDARSRIDLDGIVDAAPPPTAARIRGRTHWQERLLPRQDPSRDDVASVSPFVQPPRGHADLAP